MVRDKLSEYVRLQCDNHIDPNIVRHNLRVAGWSPDKIEKTIRNIYSKKDVHVVKGNKHLLKWLILITLLLVTVILVVYLQIMNTDPDPVNSPSQVENVKICLNVMNSVEKDDCYYEKIQEGFNCDELNDTIEKNFCFRALDRYMNFPQEVTS